MTMRPALSILAGITILLLAALACAALPATAPAGAAAATATAAAAAERFTGPQTVLAIEADFSKVDANDAARWACDVLLAIMAKDEKDLARARDEMRGQQQSCSRWITDFRAAAGGGACPIVCVTESEWILDGAYALYVPVPPAGDVERVEVVLGGGPEVRKKKQGQPRHRFDWHSDVKIWPERVVGQCIGASHAPPPPNTEHRAQLFEAFAAADATTAPPAARIVLAPDAKMREQFGQTAPPTARTFIEPMEWLLIRYDAAPLPLHVPAKLTATYRARDAAAARGVAVAWEQLIERLYTAAGCEAAEVQQIVHLLKPKVVGDRAILSIAAAELPRLIADARPAIRKAWRIPSPDRSKSTRRDDDDQDPTRNPPA